MTPPRTVALLALLAACGEGVGGGPLPLPSSAEVKPPEEQPAEPPVKRVVMQRNPYGNVAATDNLLWDGDFEFRPSFPEQYGWLIGYGFGATFGLPNLATGANCKSGIKCAVLGPGQSILGIVVAAKDRELAVSFWAYPQDGDCNGVNSALISDFQSIDAGARIPAVEPAPGPDGWCHFETITPPRTSSGYLSIESQSAQNIVVDDAVVRPLEASAQRAHAAHTPTPLPAAEEARLRALARSAHQLRLPRRAPPTEGEERLAAHLRRLTR